MTNWIHKKCAPSSSFVETESIVGYTDNNEMVASCVGCTAGVLQTNETKGGIVGAKKTVDAFGRAYHHGFLDGASKEQKIRITDSDLGEKACSIR